MRDEVLDTLNANDHWWGGFSRREIVARAMSAGLVAGWNARNANDADDFKRMRETLRLEMTSGKGAQQAEQMFRYVLAAPQPGEPDTEDGRNG